MAGLLSSLAARLTAPSPAAVKGELEKLERLWRRIQFTLNDAEEREVAEEPSQLYLSDISMDAEDVLDEWKYTLLRAEVERAAHRRTRGNASSDPATRLLADDALLRMRMAREVRGIVERADEVFRWKAAVGSLNGDGVPRPGRVGGQWPTSSLLDESSAAARSRDVEKDAIVMYISSADCAASDLSVIPIVGTALVGKTTLAQLIYNHPIVAQHFDHRVWVCLTEGFHLMGVLRSIVESLTSEPCRYTGLDTIQRILQEFLMHKRFLLVLDDFCDVNPDLWDALKTPLCSGSQGSVVLITTQNERVADRVRTGPVRTFYLDGLSGDDCWLLFKRYAYDGEDTAGGPDMAAGLREKVVEMCGGMPQVAKLIGVSFRNEPRKEAWMRLVESTVEHRTLPALLHRYHGLPARLKHCLSYCSLFPKGYLFSEEQLVRLWMAQGLIPSSKNGNQPEDIGIEYFNELVSRSFFLPSETEKCLYFMPGLMCDLVYSISRNVHSRVEDIHNLPQKARHLSLVCKSTIQCEYFYKYTGLRSFLVMQTAPYTCVMHTEIQDEMFLKLNRLRSLDLSYTDIQTLPDSVGNLKHLCFLALNHTKIKRLPESICNLYNLQTLELKDCPWLVELPRGISSLINLRHLDVGYHLLVHMPFQIQKLTSLRELPIFNLHKGNEFCAIRELKDLTNLTELGVSGLCNVANLDDARKANMQSKIFLNILKLTWPSIDSIPDSEQFSDCDGQNFLNSASEAGEEDDQNAHDHKNVRGSVDEQYYKHEKPSSCDVDHKPERLIDVPDEQDSSVSVIQLTDGINKMDIQDSVSSDAAVREEALLEILNPSINLEILYIKSYGGAKFPNWIGDSSFCYLIHVELMGCKCVVLPPLGRLPYLNFLRIDGMPVELVGTEFCGTGSANAFPKLKELFFHNMSKWKKWCGAKEGDFSSLNRLCLFNCPRLSSIPNLFSSLKVLEVERCLKLTDIPILPLLQVLKLHCCDGLMALPTLTSLKSLTVMYCQKLKSLPPLPQLENLWVEDCEQLRSIVFCSCCPPSAGLSCRISVLESLLIAHCHQLCLSPVGPLADIRSSNTGCCLVLSKFNKTHGDDN